MIEHAYAVLFKHSFVPAVFFGDFSIVNKAFHFLDHKDCLANLIYAGKTDFKLSHPEFWRHTISSLDPERRRLLGEILNKNGVRYEEFQPERWLWDFESVNDELVKNLAGQLFPESLKIGDPFIRNLGPLYVSRAAIPFIQRKCAFQFLSYLGLGFDFGMLQTADYRDVHTPISVRVRNKCNVYVNSKEPNRIELANNTLFLNCRVRVHLFPYGLVTAYFIYGITSRTPLQRQELIEATSLISSTDGSLSIKFGDNFFSSVSALCDFLVAQVGSSILKPKTAVLPTASRLHSFLTMNIQEDYLAKTDLRVADVLKVLLQDPSSVDYAPGFLGSYASILGKYKGDFAFSSSERILISLSTQWKNYRKRKTRVRYYWLFLHLFQFVSGTKYTSQILANVMQPRTAINTARINAWIAFMGKQHLRLAPTYRRFFYKLYEIQRVKPALADLSNSVNSSIAASAISEVKPEEIDEFRLCGSVSNEEAGLAWLSYMKNTSEAIIKEKICEILGDIPRKDWGGELNDHFTNIHINGEQYSAGFLLKGPSRFREMKPSHLGKNADQIYRLNCTPCDIMIIQHSHKIGEAVRATVQAFASLSSPRRKFCLIDGRDTFRILKAYNKL